MCSVVDHELGWERWPIVTIKDGASQKVYKPGPPRILVVISRHVEAQPPTAMLHILLKGRALLFGVAKIIDPQDRLILFQCRRIQIVPAGCRLEIEVIFFGGIRKKMKRLLGERNMIGLLMGRVESEYAKCRL
jgi:hypothetical protein